MIGQYRFPSSHRTRQIVKSLRFPLSTCFRTHRRAISSPLPLSLPLPPTHTHARNSMEPPPLSPLALDGSSRLDGWDVEEDFDIDLENLFDDAEGIVHNFGNQGQEQGQEPQPQQQQQSAGNVGVNGDIASIGNYTVGLLSPSEVTSGEEANTLFPNSSANINSAVVERGDEPHAIAAPTTPGPSTTATTWSTASASEDSDDCSRSTTSGNSCNFGVSSPASSPILARDMMTSSDRSSSSSSSATDTPRSITSETSTVNNDNTAVTDNHNRKRLLAVSSSARTPILPFTFAPAFGGGGGGSGSSSPSLAHFGGLQAAALAAASGAAGQALAAGWKRLRGGDDGGPGACGQASSAGSVGGGGTGAAPSRLLCGGGDGGSSAGHGRINKRAKREERLMKNREAANRSRVKVDGSPCRVVYCQRSNSSLKSLKLLPRRVETIGSGVFCWIGSDLILFLLRGKGKFFSSQNVLQYSSSRWRRWKSAQQLEKLTTFR